MFGGKQEDRRVGGDGIVVVDEMRLGTRKRYKMGKIITFVISLFTRTLSTDHKQ